MRIIGREKEQDILENCMNSGRPEFIAVYGRRRVGKTYLIRNFFLDHLSINGIYCVKKPDHRKR